MISAQEIGQLVPDIPRYVEARDLLLSEEGRVFGLEQEPELALAIQYPPDRSVFVIGRPSDAAVREAVAANGDGGDVIGEPEQGDWLERVLRGWKRSTIILHQLKFPERLPSATDDTVRFVSLGELDLAAMDNELAGELRAASEFSRIVASFVGEKPVAFCYCSAITDRQWDVSIDTLEEYRRQGHAGMAAAFMIRYQQAQGRQPVWAALEANEASWRLAEKLGFVAVDELVLFEKDEG